VSVFDFSSDDNNILSKLLQNNPKSEEIVQMLLQYLSSETEDGTSELPEELGQILEELLSSQNGTENGQPTEAYEENGIDKLFSENITQDGFKTEFNNLNSETEENSELTNYLNKISELGAENVFEALDTNDDGILNPSEIAVLKDEEGSQTISSEKLENILKSISEHNEQPFVPETPTENNDEGITPSEETTPDVNTPVSQPEATAQVPQSEQPEVNSEEDMSITVENVKKTKSAKKSSKSGGGGNHYNPSSKDDVPEAEEKETVADLMAQKKEIISTADGEIEKLNKELDEVTDSADKELLDNYETAKLAYEENEKAIADNDSKLLEYDGNLHNIEKGITSLNAELSAINENTQNQQINDKVSARIAEIQQELSELETQKSTLEAQKNELEETNKQLKENSVTLKTDMDTAFEALKETISLPERHKAEGLKEQIEQLKADKQTEVGKIDEQINVLKAQEIEESRAEGAKKGKLETNTIGEQIVNAALQYIGYKGNSDGSSIFASNGGGWCAAFVEYIVKEVGKENNIDYNKLDNHTSPSPMALYTMNKEHSYPTNAYSKAELQNIVKPGMGFVCKGGGKSGYHAGIVESVNDDGTFNTIEGNYGNRVAQSQRGLKGVYYFVDFTYLFN